ncbi:tyrosine-type recombinase/integrase [Megalodesulfovibrio gigas]|uniref:Putative site-specific recombinase n=1 Tax=Megalodesulfovibrio gigas (strain ATCC 19364 / DSM 1382 / NCIMB 9332 / VKM B-1759) TaxID=1121448 RepID=T2GD59_MEGG1|nr:tyrosine-type recombinase/integrase [Megalodesulfovibrio gigas]AGW13857.1 putative site-specific recombinase [Megalodesulfovibrio gigas DSM 1382 = ATCC 19364]AGW15062.1 putative site-specific recombinase [Megalodesulfovibrio gigas DSM 1382 = ATCC 19364]
MKVQPITELRHIRSIKRLLADNPRDKLLFVMGINSGLRVQDLLALKVSDVRNLAVGARVSIKEKKTGKSNVLLINKEISSALQEYFASTSLEDWHYLFKSRKGHNYPLTTFAVTKYVKKWCEAINLKGNFGAHTLRKTWTYMQRTVHGTSWEVLAKRLNHSTPAVTMRYMGIQAEEVEAVLLKDI